MLGNKTRPGAPDRMAKPGLFGFAPKPPPIQVAQPGAAPAGADGLIKDSSDATFMVDVVEASRSRPGDRGLLGALVRPLQAAWPGA